MSVTKSLFPSRVLKSALSLCLGASVALVSTPAGAWEPATTHAGLAEQAIAASRLHDVLVKDFGLAAGVLETATIPPADAPPLFEVLRRLNPTHGYAPDNRGQLSVGGWLVAGAVIADIPQQYAANHFYDPVAKRGLSSSSLAGLSVRVREAVFATWHRTEHPKSGFAAPAWITDASNPMGLGSFYDQLERAATAATPGERSRHLAAAMLAAGAMVHVLQDLASPSHVRDDLRAHLDRVSDDPKDRGSRHERIAALAWGRIGVPAANDVPVATQLLDLFAGSDKLQGLAAWTDANWFSAYTLPRSVDVGAPGERAALKAKIAASAVRATPATPRILDLLGARRDDGARFENELGQCLAIYRIAAGKLTWAADDDCSLEQLPSQLATASGYGAALINWLIRARVQISANGVALNVATGAGSVAVYAEDARGIRTPVGARLAVKGGEASVALAALPAMPEGAVAVAAVFVGVDANGAPLTAVARTPYPFANQ